MKSFYRNSMKIIIPLSVLFIVFASCKKEMKQEAKATKPSIGVEAYVVKHMGLDNRIKTTGNLLPNEMIELRSEVAGRIDQLVISEGKKVKKGTLLVQIDDSELQAQLRKLQAQLKLVEENEKRQKELWDINGISKVEYDRSYTELESTRADIDLTRSKIRKSKIVAPFDGTLGLRSVSEGAYVSVGTTIASLVQLDPLKLEFSVPEKYASFMKDGMTVDFSVAGNAQTFQAKVYAYQSQIDEQSRTLKVRAMLPNPDGTLIPGAFADLSILLERIDQALMVPTYCIVPLLNGQNLFVCRNGQANLINVEVGIRTEDQIQILQGISIGDTIVTTGLLAIKDKTPVSVKKIINMP